MERKRRRDQRELVFLGMVTVLLIGLLLFSAVKFKLDRQKKDPSSDATSSVIEDVEEEKEAEKNSSQQERESTEKEEKDPSSEEPASSNAPLPSASSDPTDTNTSSSSEENASSKEEIPTSEVAVVRYFSNLEATTFQGETIENASFTEKAKNAFTTVVDFLFYGSEIGGYTFSELTTSAKLQILKIALSIDHKIDEYFPNYKEIMKEKMTNLKEKAALLYLEQTSKLCEKVGEAACQEARQDFKNMKESFGFTWDLIKSAASSSYQSLKNLLAEWYASIR